MAEYAVADDMIPVELADDPELAAEYLALNHPEDREDYLLGLESLQNMRDQEFIPWEDVKEDLHR
jgi:hypothetical protein